MTRNERVAVGDSLHGLFGTLTPVPASAGNHSGESN
jgi:hypothetical protein